MVAEPSQVRLGPVAGRQRIQLVDVLRGFALIGVVLQNISDGGWAHKPDTSVDRFAAEVLDSFVHLKFQPLFAFMFGVGFCLQLERAERRKASFTLLYLWREFLLLIIGLAHFVLLWGRQDVLMEYAIAGAVLLFFRRAKPRALLLCVVLSLIAGAHSDFLLGHLKRLTGPGSMPMASQSDRAALRANPAVRELFLQRVLQARERGSYLETVRAHVEVFRAWHSSLYNVLGQYFIGAGYLFAMFLLGLYAGRRHLFEDSLSKRSVYWVMLWTGLTAIVIAGQLVPRILPDGPWRSLSVVIGERGKTAAYVAVVCLVYTMAHGQRLFIPLAWVGRLGLTNYIAASLLVTTIYCGYGFGLYPRIGLAVALLLQLGLYVVQVGLSGLWLHWFQLGPIEWLWRSAVWRKWQPLAASNSTLVTAVEAANGTPHGLQLPVPLGMDLLLASRQHVLRRDEADGAVQSDTVVVIPDDPRRLAASDTEKPGINAGEQQTDHLNTK